VYNLALLIVSFQSGATYRSVRRHAALENPFAQGQLYLQLHMVGSHVQLLKKSCVAISNPVQWIVWFRLGVSGNAVLPAAGQMVTILVHEGLCNRHPQVERHAHPQTQLKNVTTESVRFRAGYRSGLLGVLVQTHVEQPRRSAREV
jgi:hypothetical protein